MTYTIKQAKADIMRRHSATLSTAELRTLKAAGARLHRWAELKCGVEHFHNRQWTLAVEFNESLQRWEYRTMGNDANGNYFDNRSRAIDPTARAYKTITGILEPHGLYWFHQTDPRGVALYVSHQPIMDETYNSDATAIPLPVSK